jgi:hypothetical protein
MKSNVNIQFVRDTYIEDDNKWDALFVKVNDSRWYMAQPNFGTEDEQKISNIILNDPRKW